MTNEEVKLRDEELDRLRYVSLNTMLFGIAWMGVACVLMYVVDSLQIEDVFKGAAMILGVGGMLVFMWASYPQLITVSLEGYEENRKKKRPWNL